MPAALALSCIQTSPAAPGRADTRCETKDLPQQEHPAASPRPPTFLFVPSLACTSDGNYAGTPPPLGVHQQGPIPPGRWHNVPEVKPRLGEGASGSARRAAGLRGTTPIACPLLPSLSVRVAQLHQIKLLVAQISLDAEQRVPIRA